MATRKDRILKIYIYTYILIKYFNYLPTALITVSVVCNSSRTVNIAGKNILLHFF